MPCGLYADEAPPQARGHAEPARRARRRARSSPSTPRRRSRARARGSSTGVELLAPPPPPRPRRAPEPGSTGRGAERRYGTSTAPSSRAEIDALARSLLRRRSSTTRRFPEWQEAVAVGRGHRARRRRARRARSSSRSTPRCGGIALHARLPLRAARTGSSWDFVEGDGVDAHRGRVPVRADRRRRATLAHLPRSGSTPACRCPGCSPAGSTASVMRRSVDDLARRGRAPRVAPSGRPAQTPGGGLNVGDHDRADRDHDAERDQRADLDRASRGRRCGSSGDRPAPPTPPPTSPPRWPPMLMFGTLKREHEVDHDEEADLGGELRRGRGGGRSGTPPPSARRSPPEAPTVSWSGLEQQGAERAARAARRSRSPTKPRRADRGLEQRPRM